MSKKLIDLEALKTYDKEIKKYVGKFNSGSGEGSFGSQTAEALGDYSVALGENSKAISDNSVTLGKNSVAGCRGYYYQAIDFINGKIYLSNEQKPPVAVDGDDSIYIIKDYESPTYKKGSEICIFDYYCHYFCGKINNITANIIELDMNEPLDYSSIKLKDTDTVEEFDYVLFVPSQPEIGAIQIYKGGVALNEDCKASGENSVAEGIGTMSAGRASHAEGVRTRTGIHAHAEGQDTSAIGYAAHAEGYNTTAQGSRSHAEGQETQALGDYSHSEGHNTKAMRQAAHAEGWDTEANGAQSHAEGCLTKTTEEATASHVEGFYTITSSEYQHVQGKYNIEDSTGKYAHIVGNGTYTKRSNAHTLDWKGNAWFAGDVSIGENNEKLATENLVNTELSKKADKTEIILESGTGKNSIQSKKAVSGEYLGASGNYSTAIGVAVTASGECSSAEGQNTVANGQMSHAEGYFTQANGAYSHAEGKSSTASGEASHAEGYNTVSSKIGAHSEGSQTKATAKTSHAEGYNTIASGEASHAEGYMTQALSQMAHAEGKETIAKSQMSHAEGYLTQANGAYSHAEGQETIANAARSHAEGYKTNARANGAHAEGFGTYIAPGSDYQHVEGRYNKTMNGDYAHIVGNGNVTKDEKGNEVITRSNAHTLKWTGEAWFAGDVFVGENNDKLVTESRVQELASSINKIASTTEPGSIIVGTGLSISEKGVLSVTGEATETVSVADKAIADELGRNIVNTYPTVEQVNTELNNYATKQYITELNLVNQTTLANYSTTAQVETMIQNYVNESILNGEW